MFAGKSASVHKNTTFEPGRTSSTGPVLRQASAADLPMLLWLEERGFAPHMRDPETTLRRSLLSRFQEVWVLEGEDGPVIAALYLRFHKHALRVYSIAVDPSYQGQGLGLQLMDLARARAKARGLCRVILEADARNTGLLDWYRHQGYRPLRLMKDYYAPGHDAWRMQGSLSADLSTVQRASPCRM